MMRTLVSRFRMVAPPGWVMGTLVVVFGIMSIPRLVLGVRPLPGNEPGVVSRRYLIVASIGLGIYRVVAFHPYFRPNYLRWLKLTPWTVRKPLPLGPLELVPEDGLGFGLLIILSATLPAPRSIELIIVFLFSHVLVLAATFWRTGPAAFGYIAVMLLGFVPLLWTRPWLNLVLLTVIYLVVHEGLWRALKHFPWETDGILADRQKLQNNDANPPCGWFFDRFHRDIALARGISRIDAILGCMLGSWWLFVLASLVPDRNDRFAFLFLSLTGATTMSAMFRFGIYIQGYRPPISYRGRLATLRWVIPGFDQILIAPMCSLAVGPAALAVHWNSRVPFEITLSVAAGLAVLVALVSPPGLKRWRLTGQHRLVPTSQESQAASVHRMGQP